MGVGPKLSIWLILTVTVGLHFIKETQASDWSGDTEGSTSGSDDTEGSTSGSDDTEGSTSGSGDAEGSTEGLTTSTMGPTTTGDSTTPTDGSTANEASSTTELSTTSLVSETTGGSTTTTNDESIDTSPTSVTEVLTASQESTTISESTTDTLISSPLTTATTAIGNTVTPIPISTSTSNDVITTSTDMSTPSTATNVTTMSNILITDTSTLPITTNATTASTNTNTATTNTTSASVSISSGTSIGTVSNATIIPISPTTSIITNANSNISTTTTTTTSSTTTLIPTTTTTPAPPVAVVIAVVLIVPFEPALEDPNSQQFQQLEAVIVRDFTIVYRSRYGDVFLRIIVVGFRPVVTGRRMVGTEAIVEVVLNNTAPSDQIPTTDDVAQTLVSASNDGTLNISIDASSVSVIVLTTTSAPTTNATTATTTSFTPTTAVATTQILVIFTSLGESFTVDLLNPSSPAFMSRSSLIETTLKPFYDAAFPSSFISLIVLEFRNGSIINEMGLEFVPDLVPNINDITNVLINASSNITAFNISVSSITVNGTVISVSSGVSHKISLITASFFVLLSWLLSGQH